ncbi:EAL domain-containing protein [Aphanothece sacrum]|uniref:Diguanylate cyclase/phosphodiesterase, GGDEF domain protein n=1 Tax=Aphanothece sacrum FPU1 TaxID=1920663 RepID=A0A401IC72_APHSA|nr:EAL domain-containing protein [Aphanothece sacrum]GBF78832.1 diguanylate cyclase/phosphodiesterase, GGDEF domain protein [Aphanothece sacrum FPU1]GBF83064.1 diguanylate cyclase/phosphodiesterase [Aphanothece sacrum FPU3]
MNSFSDTSYSNPSSIIYLQKARKELENPEENQIAKLLHINEQLNAKIHKYQRSEIALLSTKTQLHRLLSCSPVVIYSRQASDGFALTFVSDSIKQFGYKPRQFFENRKFWSSCIHSEDVLEVCTQLLNLFDEESQICQYRLRHQNGAYRWIQDQRKLMRDDTGKAIEIIGSWQDITERKEIEQALFREKELAQVTLNSIGDGVITTDSSGRILYLNPVAEKITNWTIAEAKGQPISAVFKTVNEHSSQPEESSVNKVLRQGIQVCVNDNILLISREGDKYAIDQSAAPIYNHNKKIIGTVLVFRDVTKPRELAREVSWQANHDMLTGLINRRSFEEQLEAAIFDARTNKHNYILCYLDLDQFKVVNDTCGHIAGDELLRQLAGLLTRQVRISDHLARLGGDEFGILLHQCPLHAGEKIADKFRQTIEDFRFIWDDKTFSIGASIGLVEINADTVDLNGLLSAADAACYAAKDNGRNQLHIYQADDVEMTKQREERQWISKINVALEENRFCLYFQKIISVDSSQTSHKNHNELLIRMIDKDGKIIPPMAFIPAAERYDLMSAIDKWVVSHFFQYYPTLTDTQKQEIYTINLSGTSLTNDKFLNFLKEQLAEHEVSPETLCFEITETTAIANLSKAMVFIHELKKIGCHFALDDFGSGMSSFGYLKNLPIDYLKIDGSFIKDILTDPIDCAMVECINRLGHVMGIKTIAEFVENDEILHKLQDMEVDYAQGYGIAKPCPLFHNLQVQNSKS